MKREKTDKQASVWLLTALLAPLAQTASASSWLACAVSGGICLSLAQWSKKYIGEPSPWLARLQGLWSAVIIAKLLQWTSGYWQGYSYHQILPLILLAAAAYTAMDPKRAARVGCTLLGPVVVLLGAVLLSGVSEIKLSNLKPVWNMPDAGLITILLIPCLAAGTTGKGKGGKFLWLYAFALAVSVVTSGVLSAKVSAAAVSGVYELSRSVSLFGVAERFESLAAAAMTLGFFGAMSYLLAVPGRGKGTVWVETAAGGALYLCGLQLDSRAAAVGSLLLWLVLPVTAELKKLSKKKEKGLDK